MAFNLLVAVTIALSIKVIGIILVVALMVLPGLTALQLKRSFKTTLDRLDHLRDRRPRSLA